MELAHPLARSAAAYQRGQCWFIPASLGKFSLHRSKAPLLFARTSRLPRFMRNSAELPFPKPSLLKRFLLSTRDAWQRSTDSARGNPGRRSATRFWRVVARERQAVAQYRRKQTMLEQTVARLRPLIPAERIWTVTNGEQLPR